MIKDEDQFESEKFTHGIWYLPFAPSWFFDKGIVGFILVIKQPLEGPQVNLQNLWNFNEDSATLFM